MSNRFSDPAQSSFCRACEQTIQAEAKFCNWCGASQQAKKSRRSKAANRWAATVEPSSNSSSLLLLVIAIPLFGLALWATQATWMPLAQAVGGSAFNSCFWKVVNSGHTFNSPSGSIKIVNDHEADLRFGGMAIAADYSLENGKRIRVVPRTVLASTPIYFDIGYFSLVGDSGTFYEENYQRIMPKKKTVAPVNPDPIVSQPIQSGDEASQSTETTESAPGETSDEKLPSLAPSSLSEGYQ